MSIKLLTGVLGAGKTYYAVRHLLFKYHVWSNTLHEWTLIRPVRIYTNIVGCKIGGDLVREFGLNFWSTEGLITHTMHTVVIDRRGKVAANLEGNQFSPQQLKDLVEDVMKRAE